VVGGQHFPYRFSTGRIAQDASLKLRLAIEPTDRPMTAEADVSIWMDRGMPRFEGNVQLARSVGRAPAGARSLIIEPWRVSTRIKGDSSAAVLEQIEFQYGPDDRAVKLRGNARLSFGAQSELHGVLASSHVDLDRWLGLPEPMRRRPVSAIKHLAEIFSAAVRIPILTTLSIGVESVTLGGATLARVGADIKAGGEHLDITTMEFRAPGLTHVRLGGRLGGGAGGTSFTGSTRVEANDPRALLAWLTDRSDAQAMPPGPLRMGGDIRIGNAEIAVDRLKLDLDRISVDGRLAYAWANDGRPARLEAELAVPEIDLDRAHAIALAALGEATFDWPREGRLSLKIARAMVAGMEARQADVDMRIDAKGIDIAQLAIADYGGAAIAVKGRIDTDAKSPRGNLTVGIDARSVDGVLMLVEKVAPQAAHELRRSAGRIVPLTMRASLAVDSASGSGIGTSVFRYKIDGRSGTFRIALQGDANMPGDALKIGGLGGLGAAKVNLAGRIEAEEGRALFELIGLDRYIHVEQRPARFALTANGALDGELAVDGHLVAGALGISSNGNVRISDRAGPTANLQLKITNASVRSLRPAKARRSPELLPVSMNARLALSDGTLRFTDLKGAVAGTSVAGRLTIAMQPPFTFDGDIELGTVDLPVMIATALGIPEQGVAAGGTASVPWSAEPFEPLPYRLNGKVTLTSGRVTLTPKVAARDFRSVLRFDDSELALQDAEAGLAGGRIAGDLVLLRGPEGLAARGRLKVANASATELLPGGGVQSGRISLDVAAEGSGMSVVALIGSLAGNGSFVLEAARLARLDPSAFNNVIRSVEQGLPIDAVGVGNRMDAALAAGGLTIPRAEGSLTINAGQVRVSNPAVRAQGADLGVLGSVNLAESTIDARLTLSGAPADAPASTRPEIGIALKGSIDTPKRTIDVALLTSWLALRAVEQQSKKLDRLEGRASPPQIAPTVPEAPAQAALPEMPAAGAAAPAPARTEPEPRARPIARPKAKPTPPEQAQPLPPPIDIRPLPPARVAPRTAGPQSVPGQSQAKPQTAAPSRPRSLSEILFGN
jgi:large subunit ribosomal protein L24